VKEITMKIRMKHVVVAGAIATLGVAGGAAAVSATGGHDRETPISGAELDKASRAALASTGQGRVTETEVGDEDSYYEVEVTLDDGSQVDVQLDKNFVVVATMADDESGPDSTAAT
jgi:uncharacterized membrane protein YkoI